VYIIHPTAFAWIEVFSVVVSNTFSAMRLVSCNAAELQGYMPGVPVGQLLSNWPGVHGCVLPQ
jgi:hypothetical protein